MKAAARSVPMRDRWLPACRSLLLMCCALLPVASAQNSPPPASLLLFGAFTYGGVWSGVAEVEELEQLLGRELDIIHWYMSWQHEWDADLVASVAEERRLPLISWQSNQVSLDDIASGVQDDYIRGWAIGVREFERVVYLRPFPEMNGNWNNWHGRPELMVTAWHRIVDIFRSEGAGNVRWVWSPNVTDEPRTAENRMERYFPGADYVDVLALDGFNWGTTNPLIGWRSAEEIFRDAYDRIAPLDPRAPVWFAEIGSTDQGGSKGEWVNELLRNSWSWFPRLTAIIWFDEDKEADWRIGSSGESVRAFEMLP